MYENEPTLMAERRIYMPMPIVTRMLVSRVFDLALGSWGSSVVTAPGS